MFVLRSIQNA